MLPMFPQVRAVGALEVVLAPMLLTPDHPHRFLSHSTTTVVHLQGQLPKEEVTNELKFPTTKLPLQQQTWLVSTQVV